MTFAEANAQYELVKQRFLTGDLTDDQYDEQLRHLMVVDDDGRWWAKSRENGAWHYYDGAAETWVTAVPPVADISTMPPLTPELSTSTAPHLPTPEVAAWEQAKAEPPAPEPPAPEPPVATASLARPAASPTHSTSKGSLPKWAAVAPSLAAPDGGTRPPVDAALPAGQASAVHAGPPVGGYRAHDFAPMPELGTGLKIVLFLLSLLVPLLGFVFFAIYRKKPAHADRTAARICLILGVTSLVLYGLVLLATETVFLRSGV